MHPNILSILTKDGVLTLKAYTAKNSKKNLLKITFYIFLGVCIFLNLIIAQGRCALTNYNLLAL